MRFYRVARELVNPYIFEHPEHLIRTALFVVPMRASFVPMCVRSRPQRGHITWILVSIATILLTETEAGHISTRTGQGTYADSASVPAPQIVRMGGTG